MRHPEVIAQLSSGRRRDEWAVIERLAREEFGVVPNISATRTSAVEGFKVIDFIATFQPGRSDDTRFEQFIASAKAWILAHNVAGEGLLATMPEDEYGEDDDFAELDEDAIDAELADDGDDGRRLGRVTPWIHKSSSRRAPTCSRRCRWCRTSPR